MKVRAQAQPAQAMLLTLQCWCAWAGQNAVHAVGGEQSHAGKASNLVAALCGGIDHLEIGRAHV